jgi:hypothetical protein
MTAAAPRIAQGTPDLRRIGVVVGALTLAVALLVAMAVVRPAGGPSGASSSQAHELVVKGTNGGAIRYTGIPYAAPGTDATRSTIRFTGIPYQAVHKNQAVSKKLVVNGTQGGGIRYTGIPYPPRQVTPGKMPGRIAR